MVMVLSVGVLQINSGVRLQLALSNDMMPKTRAPGSGGVSPASLLVFSHTRYVASYQDAASIDV